jgi:site-specific recombinase XerD
LPIIGPVLEGYGIWLMKQGYSTDRLHEHVKAAPRLARQLQRRHVRRLADLTQARLRACLPTRAAVDPDLMVLVRQLDRYFETAVFLYPPLPLTSVDERVGAYTAYLEQVRGVARSTARNHRRTVAEFLMYLGYDKAPTRLEAVTARDLEGFLCAVGPRHTRASLQHVVAQLRGFLRYLASRGETPVGLERIDTPRIYRGEQLPRALPWETVRALLKTIDRTSPMGRRDYAILLLIATYGLRACDVVTLTLDDVEWRAGRLRIPQQKTRGTLWLPLTDDVGTALLDYVRDGRSALGVRRERVPFRGDPPPTCRQLFLRQRTPTRGLTPTAISMIFQHWATRSGLRIPFYGVHCLRHSYAVRLVRSGLSLKTIGDLLGHRSLESTRVYVRLAVDDLREVALDLPAAATPDDQTEVAS